MKKAYYLCKATMMFAAVASVATLGSCKGSESKDGDAAAAASQMPDPTITVEELDYTTIEFPLSYSATIKGKTDIDIRPSITAPIMQVLVDEGQTVKKGQTMFLLDPVTYQAAVDQARASVNAAQTLVNSAQETAKQKQELYDLNIISEYENTLAKNDLNQAKAQLATAQAALTNAQKVLTYTEVVAPSDGVVGVIPFREGTLVSPSSSLTTVSDNSQVYAEFSITEKALLDMTNDGNTVEQAIKEMPEVTLQLANGQDFPEKGKVETISGVISTGTGSAKVRALFNNANGMLRSGSTGKVIIPQEYDSALVIPQSATMELQNLRYVFVVDENNVVHQTPIKVSPNSDGKNFVVTEGLKKGDRIAIEGVGLGAKLKNGSKIIPVNSPQEKQAVIQKQMEAMQQASEK